MEAKEKANELVMSFYNVTSDVANRDEYDMDLDMAKKCALIATSNEYHQLREQLFNLKSARVIEFENVYLTRLQSLINEEAAVKQEIENL